MEILSKDCNSREIYRLVTGTIVPRPIAFVSTVSPSGTFNVAPFSFFNAVSGDPPIIMFAVSDRGGTEKDTLRNIRAHPEFVVNMVSREMAQHMHNASSDYLPGVSEFAETGLTPVPARTVNSIAVKEAPVHLECRLHTITKVGRNEVVFGDIVSFVIDDELVDADKRLDREKYAPIARLSGNHYMGEYKTFELAKAADKEKLLGFQDLLR